MNRPNSVDRLRRSMHFVPGANEKMLHKSIATKADSLILDLEDAVTPDRKGEARSIINNWLGSVDFNGKERCVRINSLDTPWALHDIETTMQNAPDAYVVPKVSSLDELMFISNAISRCEKKFGHPSMSVALILVSMETPKGALQVSTFTECERVVAMTWGAEDLATSLGAQTNRGSDNRYLPPFEYCRTMTLLSAVAGGVQPIDTVYVDFNDPEGLKQECQFAAKMGFTGKLTIHPSQIDMVNAAFSPSAAELEEARRLIEAFAEAEAEGRIAFSFKGKMVDVPHLNRARKMVERASLFEID